MVIRYIGDVHGKYRQYKRLIRNSPPSVQVGDMGVGFRRWPHGDFYPNPPHRLMQEGDHFFIRGNHDNPHECEQHSQWIRDGFIDDCNTMFIGGGLSIDKAHRVEGYSWWPEEELSTKYLYQLVDKYIERKPKMMVTHDCPEELAPIIAGVSGRLIKLDPRFASRTRQALQSMWSAHSPEVWVFGHWHHHFDQVANGTRFICLAELEHVDL